jgi:hypothetical protein
VEKYEKGKRNRGKCKIRKKGKEKGKGEERRGSKRVK